MDEIIQVEILDTTEAIEVSMLDEGPRGPAGFNGVGVPGGGASGQVLAKASGSDYDTEWVDQSSGVSSVNGQTGDVTITVPTKVSDLSNDSGFVDAAGAAAAAPVSSVNGSTGAVTISVPTKVSDLSNDSGFVDAAGAAAAAPVSSVNGSTGAVTVSVPSAYTSNPAALGTASPGSSTAWARGDHVHAKPTPADIGAIALPVSPSSGQFLSWNGSAWVAVTLTNYNGEVV